MSTIDGELLRQIPLTAIQKVTFYKRDEITTDLICCDVETKGEVWTFHEHQVGWTLLLQHLQELPTFRTDWFAAVAQPSFTRSETVAFRR